MKCNRFRALRQLPRELQGDTAWRAVLYLLEEAFPDDPRVWRHVDAKRWSIFFDRMLEVGSFSTGERRLLVAAAALFDAEHTVSLWDLAKTLPDKHWGLFIEAVDILRGEA